jgi:hypothetical protein
MVRWTGHVALMGEMRNACIKFWSENLEGRDHAKIILKWILKKLVVEVLIQDWIQWRAVVNTAMNLRVPLKVANF